MKILISIKQLLFVIALLILQLQLKAQYNGKNGNTYYGNDAGSNSMGNNNSFFGEYSGEYSDGYANVFNGYHSGRFNEGGYNTFIGEQSGYKNDGNGNLLFGSYSGYKNKGEFNIIFGNYAGSDNNGNYNICIGHYSANNCIGGYNIFTGESSGKNCNGNNNICTGNYSGHYNNGNNNICTGNYSGHNNNGHNNIFIGDRCGFNNKGENNIFSGNYSGYNNEGYNNIFSGDSSGYNNKSGSTNIFIGNKVGKNNTSGLANIFIGSSTGKSNITGNYNVYIGCGADGKDSISASTAIGYKAKVTASNSIVFGNSSSKVGINVSAPSYQFQLSSNSAAKPGSSTWTIASDERLKKDISDFSDGLSVLEKIHPVWFSYNGEAGMPTDKKFVGIIAQEINEVAPYMVGIFNYQDSLGNKTQYMDYDANALIYILVNSVKQQQANIAEKDKELNELKTDLISFQLEVEELKKLITSRTNTHISGFENISECCDASLEQNFPNPFNQSTTIKYNINGKAEDAIIVISSLQGIEINRYSISTYGTGEITIPANTLAAGTYFYQLIIDSEQIDIKQMELIK
jgi:hypothetical protein